MQSEGRVIAAYALSEVIPALQAIEQAAQNGLWAKGFVAYEAAPAFDPALTVRQPSDDLPLLWFTLSETNPAEEKPGREERVSFLPEFTSDTSPSEWERSIAAVHDAIGRGETYQVNLTRRLRATWPPDCDVHAVYHRLLTAQSETPYGAFLDTGRFQILSISPELFFDLRGNVLTTRPMKGTARRGRWLEEDNAIAAALTTSEKERAENVMIVDLLRNDLGRIAVPGTVKVSEMFSVERYPTVLQMTSTITATRRDGVGLAEIFTALFPCGSVTGAPKVQTMRHIAALEKSSRGVYCGAVGIVYPGGDATFNVAIRTLVRDSETGMAEYGVGGGIVWDSTAEREWQEMETKSAILTAPPHPEFDLLETLRLENGQYRFYEGHLSRVAATSAYFQRPCDITAFKMALDRLALSHSEGLWRVRFCVDAAGRPRTEIAPLQGAFQEEFSLTDSSAEAPTALRSVTLAELQISRKDIFLYHKTTHRAAYDSARHRADLEKRHLLDVLLWNEEGEITEFTIGNVVAEIEGVLWTPPRTCGLLNGVYREELLRRGVIRERILTIADVRNASRLFFINSVRGVIPVAL